MGLCACSHASARCSISIIFALRGVGVIFDRCAPLRIHDSAVLESEYIGVTWFALAV